MLVPLTSDPQQTVRIQSANQVQYEIGREAGIPKRHFVHEEVSFRQLLSSLKNLMR